MGFLRRVFDRFDPLARLSRGSDPEAPLLRLLRAQITILSSPLDEGLDPAGLSPEELASLMERAARRTAGLTVDVASMTDFENQHHETLV